MNTPSAAPEAGAALALPLLPEAPAGATVAIHAGQPVPRELFLGEVAALAATLPAGRPLLNLCAGRYAFALGLMAGISRGSLNLLPNSLAEANIAALQAQYPDLLCLSDQAEAPFGLPTLRISPAPGDAVATHTVPAIPADRRVACVFTSGSTGTPQAHFKTFGKLMRNMLCQARRCWALTGGPAAVLGTVPFQHMFGLESTVLLPLLGGGILTPARPFFPADVAAALAELPEPRFLVTTPYHLRNLLDADLPLPRLAGLLSATAPLDPALARRAEARLNAPMLEIYGSTETGQIAMRRPAHNDVWELQQDILMETGDDGVSRVRGGHLEQEQALGDIVEMLGDGRFRLLGRHADMINIAGKRSSLAFLNHTLQGVPGVSDAAFCLPQEGEASRMAAFVVAPGLDAARITAALRPHLDPVFLPRPIIFVASLPRNATGKLPADALAALIARHLSAPKTDADR